MIKKIKDFLRSFRDEVGAVRKELETLKRRRDELEFAPLCRQDVLNYFCRMIDLASERSSEMLMGYSLKQIASRDLSWEPAIHGNQLNCSILRACQGGVASENVHEVHILAAFAPQFKEYFKREIPYWSWPANASNLTIAERRAEIKKVDESIAALKKRYAELETEANKNGFRLNHF